MEYADKSVAESNLPTWDIICVSERRANANDMKEVNISGYNFYFNNSATKAGGSGIYVDNSLTDSELLNSRLNMDMSQDQRVEIQLVSKTSSVIGCVYRHPQQNLKILKTRFATIFVHSNYFKTVFGDFNIDYAELNQRLK